MTDTQRSRAELLALFANNTTHDISPQDLRDFVVSSMPSVGNDEAAFGVISPQTLTPGQEIIVPMKVFKDPNGWAIPGSYTVGVETVPANSSFVPPPGLYMVSTDFLTAPNSAADDPLDGARSNLFRVWFDWIDWDVVAAVNDTVYAGDAYFYFPTHGTRSGQPESIGQYRQTQAMYDAGQGILVRAHNFSGVTNMVINYTDIFISRVI